MSKRIAQLALVAGALTAGAVLAGCAPSHSPSSTHSTGDAQQYSPPPAQTANPYGSESNYGGTSGTYEYGGGSTDQYGNDGSAGYPSEYGSNGQPADASGSSGAISSGDGSNPLSGGGSPEAPKFDSTLGQINQMQHDGA